jgi:predicted MFS family arabinose efflux permease
LLDQLTKGLSLGPVIGGFLMAYLGYQMTFSVFAAAILLCVPFSLCALPGSVLSDQDSFLSTVSSSSDDSLKVTDCKVIDSVGSTVPTYLELINQPQTICICLLIVLMPSCQTFVDPTLELYLEKFNLSTQLIGFEFFLFSSASFLFSPIVGLFAVNRSASYRLMICGLLITVTGFLLVGPSPCLPFLTQSLPVTTVGLLLLGLGLGVAFVPTFQSLIDCTFDAGFKDVNATHAKLAVLAHSLLSIGYALFFLSHLN